MRADARIRTADPFITSEVLYQLSYVGARGILVQTKRHVADPQRGAVRSKPASAGDAMHLTVYVIAGHDARTCR